MAAKVECLGSDNDIGIVDEQDVCLCFQNEPVDGSGLVKGSLFTSIPSHQDFIAGVKVGQAGRYETEIIFARCFLSAEGDQD